MTLLQALQEKKRLSAKVASLWALLAQSSVVDEGQEPEDNPIDVKANLARAIEEQEALTIKLNETNNKVLVTVGDQSALMMHCIARRDTLKPALEALKGYINSIRTRNNRQYGETVRKVLVKGVDIKVLQKEFDDLAQELRNLDNAIQYTNVTTEL